jgi:hypothetical protein
MATTPQPPRPPVPPRTGSHVIAIALLTLALIVTVCGLAVWIGLRFLSRTVKVQVEDSGGGNKAITIKTPVGSLDVGGEVDEGRLGLPVYPGAIRMKKEGAKVDIDLPGEESVRVLAAVFETPDELETVREFYKNRLGSEVTKFTEKNHEGKTVFEIRRHGQEKIVALRHTGSGTRIEMARVTHGREETN